MKGDFDKKLANGVLEKIIVDCINEVGLPDNPNLIPKNTIVNRVLRNNLKGTLGSYSQVSPMAEVEPMLAILCRHLNRMAKSITQKEFIELANDIIKDTPTSQKLYKYQKEICGITSFEVDGKPNKLGQKYFYNFMERHSDIIHTTKINKRCVSRLEWATYPNIAKMYDLVYDEIEAAGIADKLDEPVYFDRNNNVVEADDVIAFGTSSTLKITDPSYIIFVDETGLSTNMRKDKTYNKKVIAEKGYSGTKQAISSDLRYTTMGFTAATGEPVMCCIILTSDSQKGIPTNWLTGFDITKINANFSVPTNENELIEKIKEMGSVAGGGPRCTFWNVSVPCFIQYSGHGGVTAEILTNCLARMDELELFPRVNGKKPFLLLDGHDSRFDIVFLQYIRNSNHPWAVCIGLPYGTHLWQVGDSPAQNGSYKYFEQVFKDILLREKRLRGLSLTAKPTDIVPTVNYAWERSFAVIENNRRAISERGWYPANRALLAHPDVVRTKKITDDGNLTRSATVSLEIPIRMHSAIDAPRPIINSLYGMAGTLLEESINEQRNNPFAMKRKKDRLDLGTLTKEVEQATKKLTSGTAFFNNMVALHGDGIWTHQNKWSNEREAKVQEKKKSKKKLFWDKKTKCDEIRKRPRETWSIDNINTLLTYKRQKEDKPIKKTKANRLLMLAEYDRRCIRATPPCSPIVDVQQSEIFVRDGSSPTKKNDVEIREL